MTSVCLYVSDEITGCNKCLCTNITYIRQLSNVSVLMFSRRSVISARPVAHIMCRWFQHSVYMFMTRKESGRTESLMTHATSTSRFFSFLQLFVTSSRKFCNSASSISCTHTTSHGSLNIPESPSFRCLDNRSHSTSPFPLSSVISLSFTFYSTSQCARHSSPFIMPLYTFITGYIICRSLVPDKGKSCAR